MASYCFCGCGRQVRFSDKRFSREGAKAAHILDVLENVSTPIVRGDARASATVEGLIVEGRRYWAYWRGMIHDGVGPTVGDGVQTRADFARWKRDAGDIAAAHMRARESRPEPLPSTSG